MDDGDKSHKGDNNGSKEVNSDNNCVEGDNDTEGYERNNSSTRGREYHNDDVSALPGRAMRAYGGCPAVVVILTGIF